MFHREVILFIFIILAFECFFGSNDGAVLDRSPFYSMQTTVMIKGLPRTFSYDDFQRVLADTELYVHTCKYNIPGSVLRRQKDPNAPPAYAFAEF